MTEDEVIQALEKWFQNQCCETKKYVTSDPTGCWEGLRTARGRSKQGTDIVAKKSTGRRWIVEAKGHTNAEEYSVDTPHLFGQILQRMKRAAAKKLRYAVAVPWPEGNDRLKASIRKYADSPVWEALDLWLLLVRDRCNVEAKPPKRVGLFLRRLR